MKKTLKGLAVLSLAGLLALAAWLPGVGLPSGGGGVALGPVPPAPAPKIETVYPLPAPTLSPENGQYRRMLQPVQVLTIPGLEVEASGIYRLAVRPDGKVYAWPGGLWGLWIYEEGETPYQLACHCRGTPVWTPDGLYVAGAEPGGVGIQLLYRYSWGEAEPELLAQWPYPGAVIWELAYDGERLLISDAGELKALDLAGQPLGPVVGPPVSGAFSPDARHYISIQDGLAYLATPGTEVVVPLTNLPEEFPDLREVFWQADGQRVALRFFSLNTQENRVVVVDLTGEVPKELVRVVGSAPVMHNDTLYVQAWGGLWAYPLHQDPIEPLRLLETRRPGRYHQLALDPVNERLFLLGHDFAPDQLHYIDISDLRPQVSNEALNVRPLPLPALPARAKLDEASFAAHPAGLGFVARYLGDPSGAIAWSAAGEAVLLPTYNGFPIC